MRVLGFVFALAVTCATTASTQSIRLADSLLQGGALLRAESLYYAATGARPHDAAARWALGKYLVSRGASRVGMTLLEEAIRFGGDATTIGRDLAPLYLTSGEYHALAALSVVSAAERDRAKWLVAHETRTIAPDSIVRAPFHPSADTASLGHLPMRINGRAMDVAISANVKGIVIGDQSAAPLRLHVFHGLSTANTTTVVAAADSIAIGPLVMRDVPVTIARLEGKEVAAIGLDALAKLSPTFEPAASRVLLRVSVLPSPAAAGDRVPTLITSTDVRLLQADGWSSIMSSSNTRLLREHRWTFDARRGRLLVER